MDLTKENVVRVYSGKTGCACGCRGNYTDKPASITRIFNTTKPMTPYFVFDNSSLGRDTISYWFETDTRYYMVEIKKDFDTISKL